MRGIVVYLPNAHDAPVKNPPMRKGPKPKGTLSFYGGRQRRERRQPAEQWRAVQRRQEASDGDQAATNPVLGSQIARVLGAFLKLNEEARWRVVISTEELSKKVVE